MNNDRPLVDLEQFDPFARNGTHTIAQFEFALPKKAN